MDLQEARGLRCRLTLEVDKWRAELWRCHNDSQGEDWDTTLKTVERLQKELLALREITDRRLTDKNSVIFGD